MCCKSVLIKNDFPNKTGKTTSYLEDKSHNVGIYCWRCIPSGKRYIGQSSNLKDRKRKFLLFDRVYTKEKSKIENARRYYNNCEYWDYAIIEYCTKDDLNKKEIYYIEKYNTFKLGYNSSIGGEGSRGYKLSESQKEKIRLIHIGKKLSEEHKRKLSEIGKGRKQNIEWINKRIEKKKKTIFQIDLKTNEVIKEWDSIINASKTLGISKEHICNSCKEKRKSAGGFKWQYKVN